MLRTIGRCLIALPIGLFLFIGIAFAGGKAVGGGGITGATAPTDQSAGDPFSASNPVVFQAPCSMLGTGCAAPYVETEGTYVISPSGATLICHAKITSPPHQFQTCDFDNTARTCGVFTTYPPPGGLTQTKDWLQVITPNGETTLICLCPGCTK